MSPDIVIAGAHVWGKGPTDLGFRGGRIVAPERGPRTEIIEAAGMTVVPGFQDAHVHTPFGGLNLLRVWLNDAQTPEDYLRIVTEHAGAHPGGGWITGGGWSMTLFPGGTPRKEDLDAVVPDRPVFLFNRDLHGAWVNSTALALAGITSVTPDPPDGRIERDPGTDEPSGTLHEGAAYRFYEHVVPAPTRAQWEEAILVGQRHLHSLGITGWQDAWVTAATQAAYRALAEDGRLTGRVVGALWWDRHRGLEQVDDLLARRELAAPGFLPISVKIMIDGVVENYTGAMLEPYCDGCGGHTGDRGLDYVDAELLGSAVTALDAAGFQIHMHAIGDRAVRMALDAVAEARSSNGANDNRHHIAHLQVVHPDDLPRFTALGVTSNCQMYWASSDAQMEELTIPHLGPVRASWQYPFASLQQSGARLAMGSDWPVSTANPLTQIEVGATRIDPDGPDVSAFLPDQRITAAAGIDAFTAGSAYVNHDPSGGRLEVGCRADLALLAADITQGDLASGRGLSQVPVALTVANGTIVHADL
jgi:hypothetical protein